MNPIPGIIFFVLMWTPPNAQPQFDLIEVPTAEECAILVREAINMQNERLAGVKINAQCVTVVPQTWEIKE